MEKYRCRCCNKRKERLAFYQQQFQTHKTFICIECVLMKSKLKRYEGKFQKLKEQLAKACYMEPIYTWDFE